MEVLGARRSVGVGDGGGGGVLASVGLTETAVMKSLLRGR